MTQTFYRLHATEHEFSATGAYSALWGSVWSEDGTQTECHSCAGTGREDASTYGDECNVCDGTGWEDAHEGYSCCDNPKELIAYMNEHGVVDEDDRVIVFEGTRTGTGFDGEPLAVPTRIIEETTWAEFRTRTT